MERQSSAGQPPPREPPGLVARLLWEYPLRVIGFLLVTWFISLLIELAGMALLWPELGARHAQAMMNTELGYLSRDFTRSLVMSEPAVTTMRWLSQGYQWAFVDSGFLGWLQKGQAETRSSNSEIVHALGALQSGLISALGDYLLAGMYVTVVFAIRILILVLSIPLFLMVITVAAIDGLCRRDLRRYGAGYESSFLYHHAKRFIKPSIYLPCMAYLSWPAAVYPNMLLLPAALLLGVAITVLTSSFKKYL